MQQPSPDPLFQEDLYSFSTPVVVVIPRPWGTYSGDEQSLLDKILTSVRLNPAAVRIVEQPHADLALLANLSPSKVLIFGSEAASGLVPYQATAAQGFTVILADELSQLDDQKKKNLWTALRQMFGV